MEGVLSKLSEEHILSDVSNTQRDSQNEIQFISTTNIGGRKKGTTKQLKKESNLKVTNVISTCATLYLAELEQAKKLGLANVPNGTLRKIVNEEEEKAGLSVNSISLDTIRSRVKRGNPTAISESRLSPISELEPIISEFCIRLAKMGRPLTKTTVIELANDLISDTDSQSRIVKFKEERKLKNTEKLGDAWYRGFLHRYEDVLSRNGSAIKDTKRRTWVTRDNFLYMYENVYVRMVEAGIAEKEDEEIVYVEGLPSKYKLTLPEYLLFVDEVGCNTNRLNDGKVRGEVFIVPKKSGNTTAPTRATAKLHFTVLQFISGTGVPVLCAIIFKKELEISEIPVIWKLFNSE